jgi:N-methylhydantoinase B/oxoprolinase/acetone carboxylase alpha subunit
MADAKNCRIMPTVVNDSTTGGPAVQVINACTANYIAPIVKGKASGSTFGIQVIGTTDARNEYNCSGIDSGTINGGSGNKLVRNGVQIVATGLTGTNLASGVMT